MVSLPVPETWFPTSKRFRLLGKAAQAYAKIILAPDFCELLGKGLGSWTEGLAGHGSSHVSRWKAKARGS